MFELNKPGTYIPKQVAENDFLNDKNTPQDLAKFGKTYSVVFEGDAETYLWTAKSEPEVGKEYYGHIQATSGKMMRFKVDKKEDGSYSTGKAESFDKPAWKDNSKDITLGLVYKTFVQAEGKLPSNQQEWAVIIANWNTLVNISAGTLEGVEEKPSLREKFDKVKESKTGYDPLEDVPVEAYDDEG